MNILIVPLFCSVYNILIRHPNSFYFYFVNNFIRVLDWSNAELLPWYSNLVFSTPRILLDNLNILWFNFILTHSSTLIILLFAVMNFNFFDLLIITRKTYNKHYFAIYGRSFISVYSQASFCLHGDSLFQSHFCDEVIW